MKFQFILLIKMTNKKNKDSEEFMEMDWTSQLLITLTAKIQIMSLNLIAFKKIQQ